MLSFPNISKKRLSEKTVFIYEDISSISAKTKRAYKWNGGIYLKH